MTKRDTSGEITELERGRRYSVRVRLPPDDEHKGWHWSRSRRVEGNKAEATAALVTYREELESGMSDVPVTLADYAESFQRARAALGKVSPLTLDRDRLDIARITRYLGQVSLTDLTATTIEAAYVRMAKDGTSKDAIHKCHMKLRQMMRKAYNAGLVRRNPCDAVEGITRPKQDPARKKERRITRDEAIGLARELEGEEKTGKVVAVRLALATGIRRGEALGLMWKDVDLTSKRLHVRRQYGRERVLKPPKTERSRRTIAMDAGTVSFLTEWKAQQATELGRSGQEQTDDTPVCSNELGGFTDPDDLSRWRRGFYVRLGLAHYEKKEKWTDSRGIERVRRSGYVGPNFHALRHAQASLLVAGGVDPKTVQERLGHERITTTLEIYADAEEENDVKAAEYIDGLFGNR